MEERPEEQPPKVGAFFLDDHLGQGAAFDIGVAEGFFGSFLDDFDDGVGTAESAYFAGATLDDMVATLLAVAGQVGTPRVTAAAPMIAHAAGYDIDAALEEVTEVPSAT